MALFVRHSKGKEHFVAVFDIGSGSIGGSVVALSHTQNPEVRFICREEIAFQERMQFARLLAAMQKTFALVTHEVKAFTDANNIRILDTHVTLASPWYSSQTRIVHYERDGEFLVTEKGMTKLIEREIGLFRESQIFTEGKGAGVPPEIVEAKNISVSINGYHVDRPYGKKATELDFALYISMMPGPVNTVIQEALSTEWPSFNGRFSSFSFATYDAIRDIFSDESSFLFMDISGEATDVSIVANTVLLESVSFPFGTRTLLRSLIDGRKSTKTATESDLTLYLEGNLTGKHSEDIEILISEAIEDWTKLFHDTLRQFGKEFPIPRVIFYTIDDVYGAPFESAMKKLHFSRLGSEEHQFAVRRLGMKFLGKFIGATEGVPQDPFLAIGTIMANKVIMRLPDRRLH